MMIWTHVNYDSDNWRITHDKLVVYYSYKKLMQSTYLAGTVASLVRLVVEAREVTEDIVKLNMLPLELRPVISCAIAVLTFRWTLTRIRMDWLPQQILVKSCLRRNPQPQHIHDHAKWCCYKTMLEHWLSMKLLRIYESLLPHP